MNTLSLHPENDLVSDNLVAPPAVMHEVLFYFAV